uniref:Uncharacterized protein n=1 Tax=Anguilla anguilla TaxID=7936 RepID=A0A0E9SRX8_ANGAN
MPLALYNVALTTETTITMKDINSISCSLCKQKLHC